MGEVKSVFNLKSVESMLESFVCPSERKPDIQVKKILPVIDLATPDRALLVQKFLDTSQEFGFFQVINHGISKLLREETMKIIREFHAMSSEEKERECSKDPNKSCRLNPGSENFMLKQVYAWRETLIFNCYPLEKYVDFLPENPPKFREVVVAYCGALKKLASEILEAISEGLGVERGDLEGEMSDNPVLVANHYPVCPNPSFTLGMRQHCDPTLISILFQDINGLQYLKEDEWIDVHPLDDAFVVHIGYILEVLSNGKLKAAEHRVVTNRKSSRQSLTYLVSAEGDATIKPLKSLINEVNLPIYRSVLFNELKDKYASVVGGQGEREAMLKYLSSNMS